MSVMYLVRHGQASFGAENYDKLSPKGIEQSRILGQHLIDAGILPDAIYTGTMARQKDTEIKVRERYRQSGREMPAAAMLEGLDEFDSTAIMLSQWPGMLQAEPHLAEHLPRMYESKDSFKRIFEGAMLRWVSGTSESPEVESWKAFSSRVAGAIVRIMKEQDRGKTIFVFTSGGPIAAAMQVALSLSPEAAIRLNWQVINTSYTKFMYNAERITLACFNCSSHLDLHTDRLKLISYR
jgi:broad specificity phosphatase PhoE